MAEITFYNLMIKILVTAIIRNEQMQYNLCTL